MKLHPGLEWHIFHILTSEDIDDVISCSYTVVCPTFVHKILFLPLENKIDIFAPPCRILYVCFVAGNQMFTKTVLTTLSCLVSHYETL